MHPDQQYVQKYLELYEHMNDPDYLNKTETFEALVRNPIDLPGRWYLQAITQLFRENLLAKGRFVGLGKTIKLATSPADLPAGGRVRRHHDKGTGLRRTRAAGHPKDQIVSTLCPGGHIGLFMGSRARWRRPGRKSANGLSQARPAEPRLVPLPAGHSRSASLRQRAIRDPRSAIPRAGRWRRTAAGRGRQAGGHRDRHNT